MSEVHGNPSPDDDDPLALANIAVQEAMEAEQERIEALNDNSLGGEEEVGTPTPQVGATATRSERTRAVPIHGDESEEIENRYFKVCGHDRTHIYVYQFKKKMITSRGESDWGEAALTAIAPLHWWELNFPKSDKGGLNKTLAVNWLQQLAFERGFFDPDMLRGRGAWIDDGRFVFHFGHKLWVDGAIMDLGHIDSAYLYEQGRRLRLPADKPLSGEEGKRLYQAFELFHWTRPASAILLAGWAALAPVSGALQWRPHVWITGGAGAGKTTILNLLHWLMNGVDVYAQGNSTEAGIRQTLRIDSRPVIFDESEQNNDKEVLRVQNVISLIRQSSTETGAKTLKGTQGGAAMDFNIRSMFGLGSIQVGMKHQADMERITVLALRSKREGKTDAELAQASENWKKISTGLAALHADPELPAKLLHRSLLLLPSTVQNILVFGQAAAEKFGSQRDGDQYGTLLAGAWSLVSTKVATLDEARNMIGRYDWSDYLEDSETEESDKALNTLLRRLVHIGSQDVSVYELIRRGAKLECDLDLVNQREAEAILLRHGIKLHWKGDRVEAVDVADGHDELKRLMKGSPYTDLRIHLQRIPSATMPRYTEGKSKGKRKKQRFYGNAEVFTRLPITDLVGN